MTNNQNVPPASHKRAGSLPKIAKNDKLKQSVQEPEANSYLLRNSAHFDNKEKASLKKIAMQQATAEYEKDYLDTSNAGLLEFEDSENEKDEMWDTNYTAKFEINRLKEENSRIKAKILSFEVRSIYLNIWFFF